MPRFDLLSLSPPLPCVTEWRGALGAWQFTSAPRRASLNTLRAMIRMVASPTMMRRTSLLSCVFAALLVAGASAERRDLNLQFGWNTTTREGPENVTTTNTVIVDTPTNGRVQGIVAKNATYFKGIPFAQPPLAALRFERAQPLEEKQQGGVLDASAYAPACSPHGLAPSPGNEGFNASENCLFLNVVTPNEEPPPNGSYPVFVWIHGGAFIENTGARLVTPAYASHDIILVTINYRLGPFGWLAREGITEGNAGLSDQIAALQWVQDNIESFGGDKDRVTVGGESAGAMSIIALLASPAAEGLFSRAIVESGTAALPYNNPPAGKDLFFDTVIDNAGCGDANNTKQCLQNKTFSELWESGIPNSANLNELVGYAAQPASLIEPYYPAINTSLLPTIPIEAFKSKKQRDLPILMGVNSADGALFVEGLQSVMGGVNGSSLPIPMSPISLLSIGFGAQLGDRIAEVYNITPSSPFHSLSAPCTDYFFAFSAQEVASHFDQSFLYLFNHRTTSDGVYNAVTQTLKTKGFSICENEVCHADELPYVFDQFANLSDADHGDVSTADSMVDMWSSFIKGDDLERKFGWPTFNESSPLWFEINGGLTEDRVVSNGNLTTQQLDLWGSAGLELWPQKM